MPCLYVLCDSETRLNRSESVSAPGATHSLLLQPHSGSRFLRAFLLKYRHCVQSETLNRGFLKDQSPGFPVGDAASMSGGTSGIWMWTKPLKARTPDGTDVNLGEHHLSCGGIALAIEKASFLGFPPKRLCANFELPHY